jgi:23S rRNA (cytosine1962-C5)-methyltransferase
MKVKKNTYSLIDSGYGHKLEQFGPYLIARPSAQAVWKNQLSENEWNQADAIFSREPENRWVTKHKIPDIWNIEVEGIHFKISPTDFGHLGIFPEQRNFWRWIREYISQANREVHVLNLFAYSGGATLAAAQGGAHVCHLDASKGMVDWARENATLNQLDQAPIRWIVDDVSKFLKREIRRGRKYDGIILDPPSFGRGRQGEFFKIEEDLNPILEDCRQLLSENPLFVLLSCHTPGYTPIVLQHIMNQHMPKGHLDVGEMVLEGEKNVLPLPSGTFARWVHQ